MLKTLGVHFIRHPCLTRTVRVRPPAPKKAGLCLFVVAEVWRGVELRSLGSARPCADSVRPPSCILARPAQCEFAPQLQKSRAMPVCGSGSVAGFVKMRSLGSARPCADFVRPLSRILAFAVVGVGASLHDPHSAGSPPSTKKSRAMPV